MLFPTCIKPPALATPALAPPAAHPAALAVHARVQATAVSPQQPTASVSLCGALLSASQGPLGQASSDTADATPQKTARTHVDGIRSTQPTAENRLHQARNLLSPEIINRFHHADV